MMIARIVDQKWEVSLWVPVYEDGTSELNKTAIAEQVYAAMETISEIVSIEPQLIETTISIWPDYDEWKINWRATGKVSGIPTSGTPEEVLAIVSAPGYAERKAGAHRATMAETAEPDWVLGDRGQKN